MNQQLSNIHPDAKIGKDVVIDSFVTITKDVEIGDGTWIGPNVVLFEGTRIGKNCHIFPGAVIAGIPQDLKFEGEYTTTEIGDNTTIREYVTVNRGTKAKNKTVVGSNCLIQSYAHVAHDCVVGNNCIIGSHAGLAGEVEIYDNAIVSPYAIVHQFCHIGSHAFVQAGGKVGKDIPPYVIAGRDPICYSGINSVGLRRKNMPNETIYQIQDIYRIVYQRGMNISDALQFIEENQPASKERDEIVQFIKNSKRGIIKGNSKDSE